MTFSWEVWKGDENQSGGNRTALVITSIADSLENNIKVITNHLGMNNDKRMSVLDMKIWVVRFTGAPVITHNFYKKPVASKFTIMKRSAVADKVKKDNIFHESLRRLLHISSSLPWTEVSRHLS